ncbi:MAG: peptidoglycan DD-metalloendopeptidase family protein [Chitinophagales bacterium]|nr:peptidoglycan DD-metalloendopeptidase family protein [Chitinophagales bacterium]
MINLNVLCHPTFKWIFFVTLIVLSRYDTYSQTYIEKGYNYSTKFHSPLNGELYVNGTFGEPRTNHYHSGLDFKTNGKIGEKVLSAESGYVSRIKVSATGYGNALYIDHANHLTTVYAHLDRFVEPIAQWIKKVQYEKQSFEIDTVLKEKIFFFKSGEQIAFSGNSGGSGGPHLHFEVRATESELALNPMAFGLNIKDDLAPEITHLKVYSLQNSFYDTKGELVNIRKIKNGQWLADEVLVPEGQFVFSIRAFDHQNLTPSNKNGIPELKMWVDSQLVFHRNLRYIDFSLTKYVNATVDYCDKLKQGSDFYLMTQLPGNEEISAYTSSPSDGRLSILEGEIKNIELQLIDFHGNISKISVRVKGTKSHFRNINYLSPLSINGTKKLDGAILTWGKSSFYDLIPDLPINMTKGVYSQKYNLYRDEVFPFHKGVILNFSKWSISDTLSSKMIGVAWNAKNQKKSFPTEVHDHQISVQVLEPSIVYLDIDTIAPKIELLNYNTTHQSFSGSKVNVKITDDLSGISSYKGYIDGKWVLFEYDAKNDLLTYYFDQLAKGEHQLKLLVKDFKNNTSVINVKFKKL